MELPNTAAVLRSLMDRNCCDSYAVSVCRDGATRRIFSEGVNGDTYFDVASGGKVLVTSTLILSTVGRGMLALSDTIDRFFPDVPPEKAGITVQQLLTHTSGILRYPLVPSENGHDGVAAQILATPLAFAPGSDYRYSCNGFILLGYILEKVWGKPLDRIFQERIAAPLGMTRAGFVLPEGERNRVISHRRDEDGPFPGDDENLCSLGECAGSGGQFFTLYDTEKLLSALRAKSPLLYPAALYDLAEQDYTPHYAVGRGLGYFYMDERSSPDDPLLSVGSFGHWGSTGICYYIDRPQKLELILFTNLRRGLTRNYHLSYEEYSEEFMRIRRDVLEGIRRDLF